LLERRIMSRVASILRAQTQIAIGRKSDGIAPVTYAAPNIRPGLLGTISFNEDGAIDETSRSRLEAIAKMLDEIDAPIELRASTDLGNANTIDIALGRARRVYLDLIGHNRRLAERDVAITVTGIHSPLPVNPKVEVYWRDKRVE
jgi:hypothetical protein